MVAICHSRPKRVVDVDVDLGRVERAVLGLEVVADVGRREGLADQLLGPLPQRRVADRLVGLRREREPRRQAEPAIRLADLAEQRLDLVHQLVRADVQVRVVLDELADAGQPAQRAGPLVAMEPAELTEAQRQVAVRPQVRPIDERRFRAVHRLEAEQLVLGLDDEHVLFVEVPVARLAPQPLRDDDRRADLLVAAPGLELAHRPFEGAPDDLALRDARRPSAMGTKIFFFFFFFFFFFNCVADLHLDPRFAGRVWLVDRRDFHAHQLFAKAGRAVGTFGIHRLEAAGRERRQSGDGDEPGRRSGS